MCSLKYPIKIDLFGLFIELFKGDDGCVRSVRLIRGDGSEGTHSISLLYPLELNAYTDQKKDQVIDEGTAPLRRSVRKAAAQATVKISEIAQ